MFAICGIILLPLNYINEVSWIRTNDDFSINLQFTALTTRPSLLNITFIQKLQNKKAAKKNRTFWNNGE